MLLVKQRPRSNDRTLCSACTLACKEVELYSRPTSVLALAKQIAHDKPGHLVIVHE